MLPITQNSSTATPAVEKHAKALLCTSFLCSNLWRFAASRRNEAKSVGLELQMCALNSRQDNSMYFRLLKIGSAMMEGLTGYLR